MKNKNFLPEDYQVPATGGGSYLKLTQGDTKFRILASAIVGWQYWNIDGKPVRLKELPTSTPADIRKDDEGNPEKIKHFWAFPVWNYATNKVEIAEFTQATIQKQIQSYVTDADWGSPVGDEGYDITINRTGERLSTEYQVKAVPRKPLPQEAKDAWADISIDLEALYRGDNPFASKEFDNIGSQEQPQEISVDDIPY